MGLTLNFNSSSSKPLGTGGRIFLSIFFLIFFAAGSAFEYLISRDFVRDMHVRGWPSIPCTILNRKIESVNGEKYKFTVSYRYEIHGQAHVGHEYQTTYQGSDQYYAAQKLFDLYPPKMQMMCRVDPANADAAYLVAPNLAGGFLILFPLIFIAIGAGGIFFTWRNGGMRNRPLSDGDSIGGVPKALVLGGFFSSFFLVGMGTLLFWSIPMFNRAIAARSWPAVPCTVISSQVRSQSSSGEHGGTTYSVDVLYQYRVADKRYRSNRYDLIGGSSSGSAAKQRIVNALPPGAHTVCYVDPLDPAYATLDRDLGWGALLGLFPFPFILVGAGGLWFSFRRERAAEQRSDTPRRFNSPDAAFALPWLTKRATPGSRGRNNFAEAPIIFTSAGSRLKALTAVILVAAFWNGIVSVFIHAAWFENDGGLFLKLFLIPFILVGIGLIVAVGYTFLQLFNPHVRLTVSRGELKPGETADVSWQVNGRYDRINHLTIRLEGKESTTYQNGEDSKTDHYVFANVPLADVTRSMDIHAGKTRLTIPVGTMHTLLLPSNKITWTLIVQAGIPRWPDVKETFPISVIP